MFCIGRLRADGSITLQAVRDWPTEATYRRFIEGTVVGRAATAARLL